MMTLPTNPYQLPQIWYHGTIQGHARSIAHNHMHFGEDNALSDFGPGFYLTSNLEQAKRWAARKAAFHNRHEPKKAKRESRKPIFMNGSVVEFHLDQDQLIDPNKQMNYHFFEVTDNEWSLFILGNRCSKVPNALDLSFNNKRRTFDYVYGPMADGADIWDDILKIEKGTMDPEDFLEAVKGFNFPKEHQLSVHTEKASECFIYRRCITVAPQTQRTHGARR